MISRRFISQGHLIDAGILSETFNLILEDDGDYQVIEFTIGKTHEEPSFLELEITVQDEAHLEALVGKLVRLGVSEKRPVPAEFQAAEQDGCAPTGFYSTTNHRTEVFTGDSWLPVTQQRMDACIVRRYKKMLCLKLRDIAAGDEVLCGEESVRVFPPYAEKRRDPDSFAFMDNDVSSERSVDSSVNFIAEEMQKLRETGKKLVVVAGPVVIHTGGGEALASLIRKGYVHGLLGGNAIAVHDIESQFYGTSLGVDMQTGKPTHGGHNHHMRAINRIRQAGSLKQAVVNGSLKSGLMYEVIRSGIPFCLAGSIRDDGPLPDTEMDMIRAQAQYAKIIQDSSMVLMLSTMLHAIGTGNMLPSWVKTVCIDINPAVVTKLSDRGSQQTIGIVSDVGLFLRALAAKLTEKEIES